MLIKSEQLFDRFLEELKYVCFRSNLYTQDMVKIENMRKEGKTNLIYNAGFGNQLFSKIRFVGSFFKKKMGEHLSDIDVIEFIDEKFDEKFVSRFQDIIKNLDSSSFIYMRFFCGEDIELIPPWKIDGKGSCSFSLIETEKWLKNMEESKYLNLQIKNFLKIKLDNDTVSVRDLLEVEEEMKKYSSISWKGEDIINGHVEFHGKRYDLLETLKTYNKKKTLKYIFNYMGDMLLIDYSIREPNKKIEEGSLESRSYYLEDSIKIVKMYKRWILPIYNELYDKILNETTRKYTTIAFRLDMIMRIRRYGLLSEEELQRLEKDINNYIENNSIEWKNTLKEDCQEYIKQNKTYKDFIINKKNIDSVYNDIQVLLGMEAKKGVIEMERQNMVNYANIEIIAIYQLRAVEVQRQISKINIQNRIEAGFNCPFFTVDLQDLKNIYHNGMNCLLDPVKLLKCFFSVCENLEMDPRVVNKVIFNKERYSIIKIGTYKFFEIAKKKGWEIKLNQVRKIDNTKDFFKIYKYDKLNIHYVDSHEKNITCPIGYNDKYIIYSNISKTISTFKGGKLKKMQIYAIFTTLKELEEKIKTFET